MEVMREIGEGFVESIIKRWIVYSLVKIEYMGII